MPPSSNSPSTSASSTKSSLEVLYYKRKNKVHKSKGVSKKDGLLTIETKQSNGMVTFSLLDGKQVIFRGGVNKELARQAPFLDCDDVVQVGAYEVEIVQRQEPIAPPTSALGSVSKRTNHVGKSLSTKIRPLQRNTTHAVPNKNKTTTTLPQSSSKTSSSALYQRRKPPPQPRRKTIAALSDNEASSDEIDTTTAIVSPSLFAQQQQRLGHKENTRPTTMNPLLSRKRLHSTKRLHPASGTSSNPLHKKRAIATTRVKNQSSNNNNTTTMTSSRLMDKNGVPINVPHSISTVLKPHQQQGVGFLWNRLGCTTTTTNQKGVILADEMGLGKTLMTIAVICAMHRSHRDQSFFVVCPSSLVTNWAKEFDKWVGKASQPKRVVIRKGGEDGLKQIKAFCAVKPKQQGGEVLIISYDLFRMHASSHFAKMTKPVGLLVVDEGHRLKNANGSLTVTALTSLPCDARLCITATPIQNNLVDFYTLAHFCCPGILGDLSTFRKEYERPVAALTRSDCTPDQRRLGMAKSKLLEEISQSFMLRRLQKDILKASLPPRHEVLLFTPPSPEQCRLYNQLTGKGTSSSATSDALTMLTKLRKLCSHPDLIGDEKATKPPQVLDSGKLQLLDTLLMHIRKSAPEDKVVIVSNFTSALTLIEETILKKHDLPFVRLDGTTELSNRSALVDTFNVTSADRNFAFLLSSKAGGCGLNLIGANRLVMFDPDWNPASDIQAMARVYRQGQTKECVIYRFFTAGTVEEVICQRQMQKGTLATLCIDGTVSKKEGSKSGFTKEEIRDCFTLKEGVDCDTKNKMGDRWPAYGGPEGILAQGCPDQPLLETVSMTNSPLSFVLVVNESLAGSSSSKEKDDASVETKCHKATRSSASHDENDYGTNASDAGSSDEEYEF